MPSTQVRAAWRDAAKKAGANPQAARAYVNRWLTLWKRVLDAAREHETWSEDHIWLVADFVESRRLAHEHQAAADNAGRYQKHIDSGRYFAHPALDKARDARREAREIAAELLLTPKALRDAGLDDPEDPDDAQPQGDQAGL
jgi:phage terminase small subunit